jgi:hypothetical protein
MTGSPSLLIQPAFDSRIRKYHSPLGTDSGGLQRGYMIWDAKGGPFTPTYSGGPFGDGRDMINFLYNPSTISTDFVIANGSLQAGMMFPLGGTTPILATPLQQTVSWQLYFDRTYELNYGTGAGGAGTGKQNDPGVLGVQADVVAFMQFTGMLSGSTADLIQSYADASSGGATVTSGIGGTVTAAQYSAAIGNGGIVQMVPCWVYFGNAGASVASAKTPSTNFSAVPLQLSFFGFIQEWSVQYTHFTESMTPIRCVVSVNFTMLPASNSTGLAAITQDISGVTVPYAPGVKVTAPAFDTNAGATTQSGLGAAGIGGT